MDNSFHIPSEDDEEDPQSPFEICFPHKIRQGNLDDFNIPSSNEGMPIVEETRSEQNGPLPNNSIMNSPEIILVRRITLRDVRNAFALPLQAQIEGNGQVSGLNSMADEDFPNQGSNQPLAANNSFPLTNEETPNQDSNQSYHLVPVSDERFSNQGSILPTKIRMDDLNKEMFITPMEYLKTFFKEKFGLDIDSFNCGKCLGKNIEERKKTLQKSIREILSYVPDNKDQSKKKKILKQKDILEIEKMKRISKEILERIDKIIKSNIDQTKKDELNYFLNITYENLFIHYKDNNKEFQISEGILSIINEFITLDEAIPRKREKYEKLEIYIKNPALLKSKLKEFKRRSKTIIADIKSGKRQRGKIKIFKIIRRVKKKRRGET